MELQEQDSLEVGEVFSQNLYDSDGLLVLAAGDYVTSELIAELTKNRCFQLFFDTTKTASDENRSLLDPLDPACVSAFKRVIEDAPSYIAAFVQAVNADSEKIDHKPIEDTLAQTRTLAATDPSAVLAVTLENLMQDVQGLDLSEWAGRRGMQMASLAIVAGQIMKLDDSDLHILSRAAMLHDISLPQGPPDLSSIESDSHQYDRAVEVYLNHPMRSAELLRWSIANVSELELVLVTQVHEQSDGSGFPRGLMKHHLHRFSRLLNAIDAFITLTDAQSPAGGIVPADAIAYLAQQAIYGVFDRDAVQVLAEAAAAYPVGTLVMLSDASVGRVIRSTGKNYCEPVIQRVDDQKIVDLRESSLRIDGPSEAPFQRRLSKAEMGEKLWVQDF